MKDKNIIPEQLKNVDNLIDLITSSLAGAGVVFVTLAGVVLSYNALYELAQTSGVIAPYLVWLWPLTLDALAAVSSINVLWAELRHERDKYAWGLLIGFTILSIISNAIHAGLDWILSLHPLAAMVISGFVAVLPPLAAAFALHLMVRFARRALERLSLLSTVSQVENLIKTAQIESESLTGEIEKLSSQRDKIKSELSELRKQKKYDFSISPETMAQAYKLWAERPGISGAELGRNLGKSDSLGRKIIRQFKNGQVSQ